MRDSVKVEIDEISYLIHPMSPLKANRIFIRLVKLLGVSGAKILIGFLKGKEKNKEKGNSASVLDVDFDDPEMMNKIVSGMMDFTEKLDEDDVEKMFEILLAKDFVIPNGEKFVTMEAHFNKFGLFHMYKVSFAVLKANFSDFLGGLVGSGK